MSRDQELPPVTRDRFGVPDRPEVGGELMHFDAVAGAVAPPAASSVARKIDGQTPERLTAERVRLLDRCRSLRAAHRCPGRCVLPEELQSSEARTWRGRDSLRNLP